MRWPLKVDGTSPMQVVAVDKGGKTFGSLRLDPPEKLPKTAYYLDEMPEERIEFQPQAGAVSTINNRNDLEKLSDPRATFLHERLRGNALVEIQTANGQWGRDIHLPQGANLAGKMVRVRSRAGYASTIHYSGRTAVIARDQSLLFKSVQGQWILESELENQGLAYAADAWSGVLPAEWIVPGLSLRIRQGESSGELSDLKIGAPSELLIHTIDLGMLVPPRNQFEFAKDSGAHREYTFRPYRAVG